MTTHYTHQKNGGRFELLQDGITVDGLDVELIQYQADGSDQPQLIAATKWQSEYRLLLPLECHHCAGTGIDPKKTKAPCGWCFGSGLLDAQGNPITKDSATSDQLKELIQSLRQQAERAEYRLMNLMELPGVKEIASRASAAAMRDQVYPDNNHGSLGQAYRGD